MERIDRILKHDLFIEGLHKNIEAERDRIFCRHDMQHFLDVARIGRILNAEEEAGIENELIYAAALLHDIGKYRQYAQRIPHERASADLAPDILRECGFDQNETDVIIRAILGHRDAVSAEAPGLTGILYRADKLSRACFCCPARELCDWVAEMKNMKLRY